MAEKTELRNSELERDVIRMCDMSREMLELTIEGFRSYSDKKLSQAEEIGRKVHRMEKELTERVMNAVPPSEQSVESMEISLIPAHVERIGDNLEHIIYTVRGVIREGTLFSEKALNEINTLFDKSSELLECARDAIKTKNKVLLTYIDKESKKFHATVKEFKLWHYDRLLARNCIPKASSPYIAILDYLTEIVTYTKQISDRVVVE